MRSIIADDIIRALCRREVDGFTECLSAVSVGHDIRLGENATRCVRFAIKAAHRSPAVHQRKSDKLICEVWYRYRHGVSARGIVRQRSKYTVGFTGCARESDTMNSPHHSNQPPKLDPSRR
jgi:hypothetical protein